MIKTRIDLQLYYLTLLLLKQYTIKKTLNQRSVSASAPGICNIQEAMNVLRVNTITFDFVVGRRLGEDHYL